MSTSPTDLVLGTASDLGRSFKVSSALPSVLLVGYLAAVSDDGRLRVRAQCVRHGRCRENVSFQQLAALGGLSLVVGLTLHPLQFAITQILEGYWGSGPVAAALMTVIVRTHVGRRRQILVAEGNAQATAESLIETGGSPEDRAAASMGAWNSARERSRYPERPERVMPTRLGNVLRRYEDLAGSQYGLDAITVAPHLSR